MEYISREDFCADSCGIENREGYKTCKNCSMLNVPSADVQPVKHGTWENTNTPNQLRCSNCEITHFIAQYPHGAINYCPNCGARMDGEENE